MRLKSEVLVRAGLRLCAHRAVPVTVVHRGDPDAGAIVLKVNRLQDGCTVLVQAWGETGRAVWLSASGEAPVSEPEADALLERHLSRDPDLWVLEVEDRGGYNPFAALDT